VRRAGAIRVGICAKTVLSPAEFKAFLLTPRLILNTFALFTTPASVRLPLASAISTTDSAGRAHFPELWTSSGNFLPPYRPKHL